MPIYDYYCDVCNSNFEALQKINEKPLKSCLKCKKSGGVVKLISAPGFRLKGCLLYTSPSPRDRYISRMPSSA